MYPLNPNRLTILCKGTDKIKWMQARKFYFVFFNVFSDLVIIWGAISIYHFNSFYHRFLREESYTILLIIAILYSVISVLSALYFYNKRELSRRTRLFSLFYKLIRNKQVELTYQDKTQLLFILVKFIFIPVMINFSVINFFAILTNISALHDNSFYGISKIWFFSDKIYPLLLSLLFFLDTIVFSFGYLFEAEFLKNKIRQVETSFFGWIVALACYPPLNETISTFASFSSNEMVGFGNSIFTLFMRIILLFLLIIYVSATINLGTRASNLTNRGIVTHGVYKYVRHPAYISKNMIWWICIIPVIPNNIMVIFSLLFWSFIYYLRAKTEEKFLLNDVEYQQYCNKVKYRFIPYVH